MRSHLWGYLSCTRKLIVYSQDARYSILLYTTIESITLRFVHWFIRVNNNIIINKLFCRIESDPAFVNVGSEEFVQIFVHHKIPAISNIATILLSIAEKEVIMQEVQREMDQLRDEQEQEQELNTATSGNVYYSSMDMGLVLLHLCQHIGVILVLIWLHVYTCSR